MQFQIKLNYYLTVDEINKIDKLFPTIYDINIVDEECFITMQRISGDITSLFFDKIPNVILNRFDLSLIDKENISKLFKWKTPSINRDVYKTSTNTLVLYLYNNEKRLHDYINFSTNNPNANFYKGMRIYSDFKNIDNLKNEHAKIKTIINFVSDLNIDYHIYSKFMVQVVDSIQSVYNSIIIQTNVYS